MTTTKLGSPMGRELTAQAIRHLRRRRQNNHEDGELAWDLAHTSTHVAVWLNTPLGNHASVAQLREQLAATCENLYRLGQITDRLTNDLDRLLEERARDCADIHRLVARNKELVTALDWAEREMGL